MSREGRHARVTHHSRLTTHDWWSSVLLVLVLTLVGLELRLLGLDGQSLWLDEAGRVAIASRPVADIRGGVEVIELSPPLYHYVLRTWMLVAGGGDSAVRILSALLVLPTVPLAWWLGATVGGRGVAAGAGLFSAAGPFAVHYGQEAAMYALLLPLCLIAIRAAVGVLAPPDETMDTTRPAGETTPAPGASASGGSRSPSSAPTDVRAVNLPQADALPTGARDAFNRVRCRRTVWLAVYVLAGLLALYTHYYAGFLLASVALVAIADALARRAWHGAALWGAAHAIILVAFLPWLPVFLQQVQLAASVEEWGSVSIPTAVGLWSAAVITHTAPVPLELPMVALATGAALGIWRLRAHGPAVWLLAALVVVPLLLGIAAAGFLHSFRERGYLAVAAAPWVLLAAAVFGPGARSAPDLVARAALGAAIVTGTVAGLAVHYAETGEDWRSAAAVVQALAGPEDPIVFVHFAGQLPFDRYFAGAQPRVGLPQSFAWQDGYRARYRVTPEDVEGRLGPALVRQAQAWVVLSHDAGRGSEHALTFLHRWGTLRADYQVAGVRVLRFTRVR